LIELKSLSLRNFMCIDQLDLEFETPGMMMISGENGSGKSAVFCAIALVWVSYRKGDSYKDFIQLGRESATVVHHAIFKGEPIVFDFTISNDKYETPLTRKITYRDVTYNNSECDRLFKQFDLEYLEHVMFLFQGDGSIVDLKPTDRARLLKKLFHFEFEEQVQDLKSRLDVERKRMVESTIRLEEASKVRFGKLELAPVVEVDPKKLITIQKKLDELKDVDAEAINNARAALASAEQRNAAMLTSVATLQRESADAKARADALFKQLQAVQRAPLTNVDAARAELEKVSAELLTRDHAIEGILNEITAAVAQRSKALEGYCHACGQSVAAERVLELTAEVDRLKALLEPLQSARRDAHDSKLLAMQQLETAQADARRYSTWQRDSLVNATKHTGLVDLYEAKQSALQSQSALQEAFAATIPALLSKVQEAQKLMDQVHLKEQLEAEKHQQEQLQASKLAVVAVNKEREAHNASEALREAAHAVVKAELADAISQASISIEVLTRATSILESEFPNFIILQTCSHIENYINEFVQKIFPYMQVRLSPRRGGVEFYYTVDASQSEWLSIKMASGAQAAILSLAWRVSIAKLYGISALLLDEIDASSTSENSKLIYEFVGSLDVFSQILLISHRKEALRAVASIADSVQCYTVAEGVYTAVEDPEAL